MATDREAINRSASPMKVIEESLDQNQEELEQKKRELAAYQKTRSPFLIGSIDEINNRISRLDRKLQQYTELVVESSASEGGNKNQDVYSSQSNTRAREMYEKKEKEKKEMKQFAGIFAVKSTFGPSVSERVKHISKISMHPSKTSVKKDTGKPKFVELHQFPGYDSSELTPIPHNVSALEVLVKVADAQPKLRQKNHYRPEFERLFYSQMSRAILQDLFWWYFLEKYQPSPQYQPKYFNRIAHNYVKLMTYAKHPQYRETFLKDYPSLLSQAVYAAFCAAFPDSYRQFGEPFKEDLVALVHEWVVGLKPAPRLWQSWNLDRLEPPGIKQMEDMLNQTKSTSTSSKKASLINFDMMDSGNSQMTGSQSSLNQFGGSNASSVSSLVGLQYMQRSGKKRHSMLQRKSSVSNSAASHVEKSSSLTSAIDKVAAAQHTSGLVSYPEGLSPRQYMKKKIPKIKLPESKTDFIDALTPIREFEEKNSNTDPVSPEAKDSKLSANHTFKFQLYNRHRVESQPIGKGPDFVRCVFDLHGQSPLVAQFLHMQNLQSEAGMKLRVQRTEIENLPPLDAQTYRDLIRHSYKNVHNLEKNYNELVDRGKQQDIRFVLNQKAEMKDYLKRQNELLSKPREVKKLSDLLMLELKKDRDSITAGANVALQTAMSAQL